ncbi:AAA family ATPase [Nocardioides zhouii]|uniref:ATP-binding cassette domain-containing protein n=1 Tax=Nocardioides zhouii TaxID=1168729 RepID=A0A4Q2SMI2_9ACTN|nr:AAA family ATPase [Nocardioides zhouii]RYC05269.1 ATP-binding cassette domain-containing protein [Nocardioides zhouii]
MPMRGDDVPRHPVRRVEARAGHELRPGSYPASIPAIAQVLADGLDLGPGVTFLVGENGSGKSTLVGAIATAYGLSPEGGSTHSMHSTRPTESSLGDALQLVRGAGSTKWGFFLRAETMHGWYSYLEDHPKTSGEPDPVFHEMSHGESFLALLESRFGGKGFFCLDEPEAALSFSSTLGLVATLQRVVKRRGQVLCATHSPVLAAMPGARILETGEWGLREAAWEDLDLVDHWRRYLAEPWAYLRHLADD